MNEDGMNDGGMNDGGMNDGADAPGLRLYSRRECHLCEVMEQELEALRAELRIAWQKIDVDSDPALTERYGERVPVLARADGREICHYRLDAAALRNALR